jgi:hypothetical protein
LYYAGYCTWYSTGKRISVKIEKISEKTTTIRGCGSMSSRTGSEEQISNFGLVFYLAISLGVTWFCGGGSIELLIVIVFFFLSIGKAGSKQPKKTTDYPFDIADDTDSD